MKLWEELWVWLKMKRFGDNQNCFEDQCIAVINALRNVLVTGDFKHFALIKIRSYVRKTYV